MKILNEGKYFTNYCEDVEESYYLTNDNESYRLIVTYCGCNIDYKDNEDMAPEDVDLWTAWGSHIELINLNKGGFDDDMQRLFKEDMQESYIDENSLSAYDYESLDNTEAIKDRIITHYIFKLA